MSARAGKAGGMAGPSVLNGGGTSRAILVMCSVAPVHSKETGFRRVAEAVTPLWQQGVRLHRCSASSFTAAPASSTMLAPRGSFFTAATAATMLAHQIPGENLLFSSGRTDASYCSAWLGCRDKYQHLKPLPPRRYPSARSCIY